MQSSEVVLGMLGLRKYSKVFTEAGLGTVSQLVAAEEEACKLLRTRHERDVLSGYLRVRSLQGRDAAELPEKRAAAYEFVRNTLSTLASLQARKSAAVSRGADIADILDAIDDARHNLILGQRALESLSKESSQHTHSQGRGYGSTAAGPRVGAASGGWAGTSAPPRGTSATPRALYATARLDPNNWNRNAPTTRVERLARGHPATSLSRRAATPGVQGGLEVVGAKAHCVSLGLGVSNGEQSEMCCGATFRQSNVKM